MIKFLTMSGDTVWSERKLRTKLMINGSNFAFGKLPLQSARKKGRRVWATNSESA